MPLYGIPIQECTFAAMERYLAAFECVNETDEKKHQFMCLPLRLEDNEFALVVNCLGSHQPPQLMHFDASSGTYRFRSAMVPEVFLAAADIINTAISEQVLIQIRTGQVQGE